MEEDDEIEPSVVLGLLALPLRGWERARRVSPSLVSLACAWFLLWLWEEDEEEEEEQAPLAAVKPCITSEAVCGRAAREDDLLFPLPLPLMVLMLVRGLLVRLELTVLLWLSVLLSKLSSTPRACGRVCACGGASDCTCACACFFFFLDFFCGAAGAACSACSFCSCSCLSPYCNSFSMMGWFVLVVAVPVLVLVTEA